MDVIGLVQADVSGVLGVDPRPLQNLVENLTDPDEKIVEAANSLLNRSILADPNRFFFRLTSMTIFRKRTQGKALFCLRSLLALEDYKHWYSLNTDTKDTIKELLLWNVSNVSQDKARRLKLLSDIIAKIASAPVRVGPNPSKTEPWDELLLYLTEYLDSPSNIMQMFSLSVIIAAPQFLRDMLEADNSGNLKRISDRLAIFLTSDNLDLKLAALTAMITLWVVLSDADKIVIQGNMSLIFMALPLVVDKHEHAVAELLMKLEYHITFESFTETCLQELAEPLLMLQKSEMIGFDTKRKAISLMLKLAQWMSESSVEIYIEAYLQKFLEVTLCLMSKIEHEEYDDDNRDNVQHVYNFGRSTCGSIILMFGANRIVHYCHDLIDGFMNPSEAWQKRYASITAVGQLSLRIPHEMPKEHLKKVMNWILTSLNDSDEKVIWATCVTIKKLARCIRGCHEKKRKALVMRLCHHIKSPCHPQVKHCLEEAYTKVSGR